MYKLKRLLIVNERSKYHILVIHFQIALGNFQKDRIKKWNPYCSICLFSTNWCKTRRKQIFIGDINKFLSNLSEDTDIIAVSVSKGLLLVLWQWLNANLEENISTSSHTVRKRRERPPSNKSTMYLGSR